eukprot:jgi/Astpho2/241/Aster-02140
MQQSLCSVSRHNRFITRAEEGQKGQEAEQPVNQGGSAYIDELPPTPKSEPSADMKRRMREEYLGLGGSPNKPLQTNWFLVIIGVISFLAILSWVTGSV